jgi:hypothetical protein
MKIGRPGSLDITRRQINWIGAAKNRDKAVSLTLRGWGGSLWETSSTGKLKLKFAVCRCKRAANDTDFIHNDLILHIIAKFQCFLLGFEVCNNIFQKYLNSPSDKLPSIFKIVNGFNESKALMIYSDIIPTVLSLVFVCPLYKINIWNLYFLK